MPCNYCFVSNCRNMRAALVEANKTIEELRKSHAQWQPAVVEYRGRKISEAILRLQKQNSF
jgi:hypothetical protein